MGHLRNNGVRAQPIFPYVVWGVRDRTLLGKERTNNFAEAFHRKLQLAFGVANPVIWKIIDAIKKLKKLFYADYERYVAGHAPPKKRARYEDADEHIVNKLTAYDGQNIMEFQRGMSYNHCMD